MDVKPVARSEFGRFLGIFLGQLVKDLPALLVMGSGFILVWSMAHAPSYSPERAPVGLFGMLCLLWLFRLGRAAVSDLGKGAKDDDSLPYF
jgi:hypothetical protein